MTLENWLANRWIKREATSPDEIGTLLAKIDRDISAAQISKNPSDWRLAMAYNACLGCATTALRCTGHRIDERSGHHFRTIDSLRLTLRSDPFLIDTLQATRQKRNVSTYEAAGRISEAEVEETLQAARELRVLVVKWINDNYPDLIG